MRKRMLHLSSNPNFVRRYVARQTEAIEAIGIGLNRIANAIERRNQLIVAQQASFNALLKTVMPMVKKVVKDALRPPKPFVYPGNPLRKRRTPRRAHARLISSSLPEQPQRGTTIAKKTSS